MDKKEIIKIHHLSVIYPDSTNALSNINLSVKEGEFIAVMGRTGAGKSTLGLVIANLIPRVIKARVEGDVKINENDVYKSLLRTGIVFQDFETQLFSTNVLLEIAFVLENSMIPSAEIKRRCKEVLTLLKIEHLAMRNVQTLSGGEKQIVAIASVISGNFKILLLDEPTTDLDPLGKSMVYDVFNRTPGTKIFIDNEPEKTLKANRIIILKNGEIVIQGSPPKILADNHILEDNGIKPIDTNKVFPGILDIEDSLKFIKENKIKIQKVNFDKTENKDKERIIECNSLSFGYRKDTPVLNNINLVINRGDFISIIGQNGSGKTTLAKLLCRLLTPQKGNIKIKNKDIREYTRKELASIVGYVFQNPDHQIFCNTVKEEITFALKNYGWDNNMIEETTKEVLGLCDLAGYEDKDPFSLTKGEKQRLAVATVLAFKPEIIILDEPTTGLDYKQVKDIMSLLKSLNKKGYTIIIITHTMWLVAEYTNRTLVMAGGRIVIDKNTREVFRNEEELIKHHLEPPQICRLGNRLGLSILTVEEFKRCIYI